jgi:hypothetical protein
MKINSASIWYLVWTAVLFAVSLISVNAQAPASIAGNTFGVEITSGSGVAFANSGYYLFLSTNSTGYSLIGLGNISSTTGIYSYSAAGAIGSITLDDSLAEFISGSFSFNTAFSGSDSLTDLNYGGSQTGNFIMFTNPVPNSIIGQNFFVNVQAGGSPFASSGDFIITTAASGNSYNLTAIGDGVINSTGTYSYSKLNASCGGIQLNDSVTGVSTAYLALSNSVSGGYYLRQPSTGGYQVGLVTLLNAQAPTSIAGNSFITAVTSGTPPFATGGNFIFLPANSGNSYQVIGLGGVANSSGTYSYLSSGAAGTVNFTDSINGAIKGNFVYYSSILGSYILTTGSSGQYNQNGAFGMFTNPVPNSIAGQGFYITLTNGSFPFAANGSFTFATATSGNSYTLTAISGGVTNSTGTYSYSKLNASCGGIQLTDSVTGVSTVYLALSNSVSGDYVLTQPSSGGYQIGFVSILNTATAITSPTTASIYTNASNTVNLGGTASDNLGITKVTWSNNLGGNGTASGTIAWTANGVVLQSGTNLITVTAYDTVSNTAQATLTVIYNPPDTTPPTISITSPTSAATYLTNVSSINLGGTASDNVGVTQVTWTNNRGGSGTASGTLNWSITGIVLQSGTNLITVIAHDAAGNTNKATLTVTNDTTPPIISITTPTSASTYNTFLNSINLGGTASDNVGVTQVTWSNNHGGSGAASGTSTWSINGVVLQLGTNVITITAYDSAGNISQTMIGAIYSLPVINLNTGGNKIVLTWPTNAAGFSLQDTASLSGTSVWSSALSPVVNGSNYVVTNTISGGAMFYRLKK